MRRREVWLSVFFCGLAWQLASCASSAAESVAPQAIEGKASELVVATEPGVSTGTAMLLSDGERVRLESAALDGSAGAAYRLLLFFDTRDPARPGDALFWAQVAAENGHRGAQYVLALKLHQEGKRADDGRLLRRSCYWLRKAVKQGMKLGSEQNGTCTSQ